MRTFQVDLVSEITGHEVDTVTGMGWSGVTNGELLRRAEGRFEAFITMDRNLEYQQPLARQPFDVILIRARSNRMVHLVPLVPQLSKELAGVRPGELRTIGD